MKHDPRPGDLPVKELVRRAEKQIRTDREHGFKTDVYFKFSCEQCGERCTFQEPNQIWEEGECARCGHLTKVTVGGFMLASTPLQSKAAHE